MRLWHFLFGHRFETKILGTVLAVKVNGFRPHDFAHESEYQRNEKWLDLLLGYTETVFICRCGKIHRVKVRGTVTTEAAAEISRPGKSDDEVRRLRKMTGLD